MREYHYKRLLGLFSWRIAEAGYVIKNKHVEVSPENTRYTTYQPLGVEALFGKFADTPATDKGVVDFANKFGNLRDGETDLEEWLGELRDMKWCLDLFNAIEKRKGLSGFIKWRDSDTLVSFSPDGEQVFDTRFRNEEVFNAFQPGDLLMPTRHLLGYAVNTKLEQHHIIPQVFLNLDLGTLEPYVWPGTLIGVLWFQFFEMVSGNIKLKRCSICGDWENVAGKRSDWTRHYSCAAKVRAAESYERKKAAKKGAKS